MATRWTIRHGLMLLWFKDLMNVTKEAIIHRPNISTLLSSAFIRGDSNAATRGRFIPSLISCLFFWWGVNRHQFVNLPTQRNNLLSILITLFAIKVCSQNFTQEGWLFTIFTQFEGWGEEICFKCPKGKWPYKDSSPQLPKTSYN